MSRFAGRVYLSGGSHFGPDEEDFAGLTVPLDKDLWLIGDLGITLTSGKVSQWNDQSGNGHHVTQASGSLQPTVATPSDGNGHQAVRWTGAQILQSANVDWGSATQATMFIVAKKTSPIQMVLVDKGNPAVTAGIELIVNSVGRSIEILATQPGGTYSYFSTGANTYPETSVPLIYSGVWDTALSSANEQKLWIQGFSQGLVDQAAGTNLTSLGGNNPYTVGARPSGILPLIGDLYEIIVYKRALSTSERRAVELYLATRYDLLTDQRPMTSALQYSNCTVWLDPTIGLTTVDAALPAPNDFTDPSWFDIGLSTVSAHTITEDNSVGIHVTTVSAAGNGMLPDHRYHVRADIPASSGNGRYVGVFTGNGSEQVYLDTQLGTVFSTAGDVFNVTYVDGILNFDAISTSGPNVYLSTNDGIAHLAFAGNGLRTATCTNIQITQRNVSTWANQGTGGSAWDVTQGTAALKPTLISDGGEHGGPALFYGAAGQTLASGSAVLSQPFTAIIRVASTSIDGVQREFLDSSQTTWGRLMGKDSSDDLFIYAGIAIFRTPPFVDGVFYRVAGVFNGVASLARLEDSESNGDVGTNPANGLTVGSRRGGGANGWIGWIEDVILYDRPMSRAEISVVNVFLNS